MGVGSELWDNIIGIVATLNFHFIWLVTTSTSVDYSSDEQKNRE